MRRDNRNHQGTRGKTDYYRGGIDYSKDLLWVKESPIDGDNIVYASHIYPIHTNWDYYFGDIAEKYPVLITEWGLWMKTETQPNSIT